MSFNSQAFLLFLPVVFALYWGVFRSLRAQNLFLVAASCVFYAWWDARFLALIAFVTAAGFLSGVLMGRPGAGRGLRRLACAACVAVCLGVLCLFKYYGFFALNAARVMALLGMRADVPTLRLALPVGISFYTFQALGYSIDVYKRRLQPCLSPVDFAVYISFFPQLVAGPIERAGALLPQLRRQRVFSYTRAVSGCRLMLWGFFKKIVVADTCALAVDQVWRNFHALDGATLLCGALLFSVQIYGDFSGYSDIAVGTARLLGIELTRNFRYPYFARSAAEFWRRWHVSLTSWLRDYVYIPLGGSRISPTRTMLNTIAVFLLCGLWHGAGWTFLVWGLYNAVLVLLSRLPGGCQAVAAVANAPWRIPRELACMVITFLLATVGWVVFRAPSLPAAGAFLCGMVSRLSLRAPAVGGWEELALTCAMLAVEWPYHKCMRAQGVAVPWAAVPRLGRWLAYLLLALFVAVYWRRQSEFIYFQF